MTSESTSIPDDLPGRIASTLHHRAAVVEVEDRLDRITRGVEPPLAGQAGAVARPLPAGGRRPVASRLVFVGAAAVLAAGLILTLWHRAGDERLGPATGPSPDARIYPVVDPGVLEVQGVTPLPSGGVQGDRAAISGPALVLGRVEGDRVIDLITVTVAADPTDAGGGTLAQDFAGWLGLPTLGREAVTTTIGSRTVRLPYAAGGPTELVVWLQPAASQADIDAVHALLADALVVRSVTYVNQEATWNTFQQYYADRPDVLDLVDPADLPTSFLVEMEVDDRSVADSLRAEVAAMPGVSNVMPDADFQRYEWDEGGATIIVDTAPGSSAPVEAVIATLSVTPQADGQPPGVSVTGQPPYGMSVMAGPSAPVDVPLPWINLSYETGGSRIMVTRQPSIDPRASHVWVTVRGRRGYLSEQDGGITLTWPIDDDGWWAQLIGSGLTSGQAIDLAGVVTFTDEATWTGLYPSGPTTTFETAPPVTDDASASTTSTTGP